jgi:3-oxoacyl-[acyl-carrier protein] reductase
MNLELDGRTAFIAGASTGLGYAAAAALLGEGCDVAICSRSVERVNAAARSLRSRLRTPDQQVVPLQCDVTDAAAIEQAFERVEKSFGKLNVLVTNAGGPPAGPIADFSADDFRQALELNLVSAINLVQRARPLLETAARNDGHARIIMVTSVSAKQPLPSLVLSNTARAGLQGYAKTLADELGSLGITVNTVLPGYTETERLDELADALHRRSGRTREEIRSEWAEQNALKRLGDPAEFAAVVTFLAGKRAGYVTGVALPVDGGRSRHLL